ncbi:hypothetical protein BN7_6249 [Wickerhamomyces ciferrii]|uniref:UPF3 domain-containing protein n=1 Tax=Wickerhamomyces ciferrii (strain ATCC 14091 / BCRC 22168 / CBS 111 / JCM 3599 / NBRC 0793 / NRRL Y-1031 F-60-10) TaxID=1206466 RepID=K0KZ54_WICCF|nr:uncharacterized protein BN7_6249 [Wickerhamomyces ciferrii]CCH46654.1 hypothetical protein BN7_6249 [Wickerhamomyces ciferrii]
MNVAGSRAPAGRPKILTREDFEKKSQAQSQQNSATPSPPSSGNSSGKPKSRNRRRKPLSKKKSDAGFKVVVRLLPPNLKAEEFWSKVEDYVTAQNILDKYYVQGKYSNKPFKLPTYSRAYIQFEDPQIVDQFVAKYKEVTFEDDKESMIPTFAMALFSKMPENEKSPSKKPDSKPKHTLQDLLSYKNFLKFYNGEIERPQSFLISEKNDKRAEKRAAKKAEKKAEKKVEKKNEKGEKKEVQPSKKNDKKKREKKDIKKDEKSGSKDIKKDVKKDTKKDDKPKDAKNQPAAATNATQKKESPAGDEEKKKRKPRIRKKKEGEQPDNKPVKDKPQQKNDSKPKNPKGEKPKPKSKPQEKKPQNNGGNAKNNTGNNNNSNGANPKPKIQLLGRDDKNGQDKPKKPVLLKRDN